MHTNSTTHRSHKGKNWIFVENGQKMCDWMIALGKKIVSIFTSDDDKRTKAINLQEKAKIVPPCTFHRMIFSLCSIRVRQ